MQSESAVVAGKVLLAALLSGVVLAGLLSSRSSGAGRMTVAVLSAALIGAAAGAGYFAAATLLAILAFAVLFIPAWMSGENSSGDRVDDESPL